MSDTNTADSNGTVGPKTIKRFRKPLRIILVLIVVSVLVLAGIGMLSSPCDRTKATYSNFVIEENESPAEISERLMDEGMIKSAKGFEFLSKMSRSDKFRPGTYFISPSMSSINIIRTLSSGLTTSAGFTIPAGYTLDQVATALDRDGLADRDAFLKAAASPELKELDIISEGSGDLKGKDLIEGFLFPSEYSLSVDADESMMIIMMIDAFSNFYNDDYRARADEMGISPREVLIIASMIEKETSLDKERAGISAVIHNRYNMDMMSDEEIPKAPLCSPGRESIIAALYPEENEYTYYVLSSKLDGTHVFTSDEEEYQALLAEYNEAVSAKEAAEAEKKAEKEAEASEESADEAGADVPAEASDAGADAEESEVN